MSSASAKALKGLRRLVATRAAAGGAAAPLLLVTGVALAALVTVTSTGDFDDNSAVKLNIITSIGNSARLDVVDSEIANWYRAPWTEVSPTWEVQAQHDDTLVFFKNADRCLRADQNTLDAADPVTLGTFKFRTGAAVKNIGGNDYISTIQPDLVMDLPGVTVGGALDTFSKIRFATLGSHIAEQSYTITINYANIAPVAKTATIKLDTVTGATRDSNVNGVKVTNVTGLAHNTLSVFDADGANGTDCLGDGGDVVEVTNPNPTEPVDSIVFAYTAYTDGTANLGWLGGPIAVSLVTDQAGIEGTYTYQGEYGSPTDTVDAVGASAAGHAIWYDFRFNPAVTSGSSIALYVACGDDEDTDGKIETTEYTAAEQVFFLEDEAPNTFVPLVDCVGRYLHYRLEFTDDFADTTTTANTGLRVDDIAFDYDLDADEDGYTVNGNAGLSGIDCDDNNAARHPGASDVAGDGVDMDCNGLEACYQDTDNDGYRLNTTTVANDADCTDPGEAVSTDPTLDCNDNNAAINPLANEITGDSVDQNCNGQETCYQDADNDGDRTASTVTSADTDCTDNFEGVTGDDIDCDDGDPDRFNGNPEITGDQKDQDCDGGENCWPDLDNDNARASTGIRVSADQDCADSSEQVTSAPIDCDDGDASQFPGNTEITGDGKDGDCSGLTTPANTETCFLDNDDDGYPDAVLTIASADEDCADTREGTNLEADDCNDSNSTIHPNAVDVCGNGVDDDCDNAGDHADPATWLDDDNDNLLYASEIANGTNDCDSDSDNDNLNDYDEVILTHTVPTDSDSDNDHMNDDVEVGANHSAPINTDGDSLVDALDPDDDNDGNLSTFEDVDGDGNPRDDNQDGDTLVNVLDPDDDGDGVITDTEDLNNNGNYGDDNSDSDGVPDWLDNNDDQDGILTINEDVNNNGSRTDDNTDGDSLPNYRDPDDDNDTVLTINENVNGVSDARDDDTDLDTIPNFRDTDDDNDGILTSFEYSDGPGKNPDADTLENHLDPDSDGDGYLDSIEGRVATDTDGVYDYLDLDSDGDTVLDASEVVEDFDSDGKTNRVDSDDDNDGITTAQEQIDILTGDADADGTTAYRDIDSDGDGYLDSYEWTVIRSSTDDDGDGKKNYVDKDSDGDTLVDKNELGTSATPVDTDGDTFQNRIDSDDDGDCVLTKNEIGTDFDVDGSDNYLDTDDDNDGELSCAEDANGNGDAFDDDTDGDGAKNHVDQDDDNDDILTIVENAVSAGRDVDGDGKANGIDTDSDGDGWYDDDESVAGVLLNFDGDANADFVDTDSDNDLVTDSREGSSTNHRDTDFDGDLDRLDGDDDNDQILTAEEWSESDDNLPWNDDFDNDTIADYMDFDDDNDGVLTYDEDVDNSGDPRDDDSEFTPDGKPDYLDTDDDNDTVLTIFEDPNTNGMPLDDDTDNDIVPNYRDDDDDGDLLFTSTETLLHDEGSGSSDPRVYDWDADGVPNFLDADDDDDLVNTYCEVYVGFGTHLEVDADADTILDGIEWYNYLLNNPDVLVAADAFDLYTGNVTGDPIGNGCEVPWDRDSDGTPNVLDSDDDNDGLSTGTEELGTDIDCLPGTQVPGGDGVPDYVDQDSDNDGILDGDEAIGVDSDGDFIVDFLDCDSTGCAGDSDQDGILNCDEGDTLCKDLADASRCPIDPDYDQDGVIDGVEVGANLANPKDSDGDSLPDFRDADDDADDQYSWWENGMTDCVMSLIDPTQPDLRDRYQCTSQSGCSTGYWYFECVSATTGERLTFDFGGNDLSNYPNLDAATGEALPVYPDTTPNFLDTDDDGDGRPTVVEGMDDDDGDGLPNGYDPYDYDGPAADPDGDGLLTQLEIDAPLKTRPYDSDSDGDLLADGFEVGPNLSEPYNHDGDDLIDALDPDDDDDGIPTAIEGTTDPDGDTIPSYLDDDSDGDGKEDRDESGDTDADCDGLWDSLDGNDTDGPCLTDAVAGGDGLYVNQGCTCALGGGPPGASTGALVLGAALVAAARRRRRVSRVVTRGAVAFPPR